jgi:hypothetical protein
MKRAFPRFEQLISLFVGAILFTVYFMTLAPGLTWANNGSDGGDLISAAATGGVAHPTGYPVYLLAAQLFQLFPFGSLAFRTNLLSAISMVAASMLVFATVRRSLEASQPWERALAALVAALAFGLSPLAWSQAVITEVYSLHVLFISLLLYLITAWTSESQIKNGVIGLVQGLAVGNHLLAILMTPGLILTVCVKRLPDSGLKSPTRKQWRWNWRSFGSLFMGIISGLCSYMILPLRARANPPVNWGNPVTPARFAWLVSGQLYHDRFIQFDPSVLWQHLEAWANLALQQFGFFGLLIGLAGLVVFFTPSRLYFLTLWTSLVFILFAVQYSVIDSFVDLLPAFLVFSIWIGLGMGQIMGFTSRYQKQSSWAILLICFTYLSLLGAGDWPQADASHDLRAETFGKMVLHEAPSGAILFAEGDRTVFTLWYFLYGLRLRPDVIVLADSLLPFDWYRENLRRVYPDLRLPESTADTWLSAIRGANTERPTCYPFYLEPALVCE